MNITKAHDNLDVYYAFYRVRAMLPAIYIYIAL